MPDSPTAAPTAVPPALTWLIDPAPFKRDELFAPGARALALLLALLAVAGFGLRAANLSAEGLSEDELNKLQAVGDYREFGLSPANAEHPMLMKAIQTVSVVLAERWNERFVTGTDEDLSASPAAALQESARRRKEGAAAAGREEFRAPNIPESDSALWVAPETALRLPSALFGALTTLLIFSVGRALFGPSVGLVAAALWALDPTAISFNRIAKEDTFFVFFFLLANHWWFKAQARAERGQGDFRPLVWASAAAFGAMVASKYYPHFIGVSAAYYYLFLRIPATRWRIGKQRWLIFIAIMGLVFVLCNLTIMLPGTWAEMRTFASERRIGHDAYEFMSALYPNQMTKWLAGVPWTFYFLFTLVKLPPLTLAGLLAGLPLMFTRRLGDGRYLILFWLLFFFMPFSVLGGKFARYYTLVMPPVLITAAVGACFCARLAAARAGQSPRARRLVASTIVVVVVAASIYASLSAAPYYRLYNNVLGGGAARAGDYFPHDDFYDASMRDAALAVVRLGASPGARVASESPRLFLHYAALAGRTDLQAVSLSDPAARDELRPGDFLIVARGRRYFSNDAVLRTLDESGATPAATLSLGDIPSTKVYQLDEASARTVRQ